ncbi:MAG: hypothetical protein LBM75_02940 [Myxococcales bacterium]|jgi:DNA-binding beta-propeller fold protein YncE|nr:hypothetical protein [Myxococcales bacterium]
MSRLTANASLPLFALALTFAACGGKGSDTPSDDVKPYQGTHAQTKLMGTNDNAEVIRALPNSNKVLLLSSKARKLTLLEIDGARLSVLAEKVLFPEDSSESELTNLAIAPDSAYAVATRTIITTGADGEQTNCGGELVFIDIAAGAAFGTILQQLAVGPMPDAVAISDDGRFAVSADERDGPDAWGKCEVLGKTASISVIQIGEGGPASARVFRQITMIDEVGVGPREPESVAISKDSDRVVVTLQDSHELAIFDISALPDEAQLTSEHAAVKIVKLPPNDLGAFPWPDGVLVFDDADGQEFFAIAGEWNDRLIVVDRDGTAIANEELSPRQLPESLPRVVDSGSPLFSPDSLAGFTYDGVPYLAVTLRHSGAVAFYDVSNAAAPAYRSAVKVGQNEQGGIDEDGSTVRPEGICAASDGRFVATANEGESSVSLILPE